MRKDKNMLAKRKKPFSSKLSIVGGVVLSLGAAASTGVCCWQVTRSNYYGSGFTNNISFRSKVDFDKSILEKEDEKVNQIKEASNTISSYLNYHGVNTYETSYEYYGDKLGYITTKIPMSHTKSQMANESENVKKGDYIEQDHWLDYFENVVNEDITIVYSWFDKWSSGEKEWNPAYTIFKLKDILSPADDVYPKAMNNKDGNAGIIYKVTDGDITLANEKKVNAKELLNAIYKDCYEAYTAASPEKEEKKKYNDKQWPRLMFIKNFNNFFNEGNYHLAAYSEKDFVGRKNTNGYTQDITYQQIYGYEGEPTDYYTYADDYNKDYPEYVEHNKKFLDDWQLSNVFHPESSSSYIKENYISRFVKYGSLLNVIYNSAATSTITSKYNWANRYVVSSYGYDGVYSDELNNVVIPKTINGKIENDLEPKSGEAKNIDFLWRSSTSLQAAKNLVTEFEKYSWKVNPSLVDLKDEASAPKIVDQMAQQINLKAYKAPYNVSNHSTAIWRALISFLVMLIVLLIILAVLFRTTGFLSWLCNIFALSLTFVIINVFKHEISLSMVFGLIALSIGGFLMSIGICSRMKRQLKAGADIYTIITNTFKKALMPILDICAITMIYGLVLMYLSQNTWRNFGIVMIMGSIFMFLGVIVLNFVLHWLFFCNDVGFAAYWSLGNSPTILKNVQNQKMQEVKKSIVFAGYELDYFTRFQSLKLKAASKKSFWITFFAIFGALLIAGIVMFSIFTFSNKDLYFYPYAISITGASEDLKKFADALKEQGINISHSFYGNGQWTFYFNSVIDSTVLSKIASSLSLEVNTDIFFTNTTSSSSFSMLTSGISAIAISTAISAAYLLILRLKFASFVPFLITTILTSVMTMGLVSLFFIGFDEAGVSAFAMCGYLNCVMTMFYVSDANAAITKKDYYAKEKNREILTEVFKNNISNLIIYFALILSFVAMFGILVPSSVKAVEIISVNAIVDILFVGSIYCFFQYHFNTLRNRIMRKSYQNFINKKNVNLDPLDEQLLDGFNNYPKFNVNSNLGNEISKQNANEAK